LYSWFLILYGSWVQSQLQNHPDELWEDGVRDYLSHSSHIMVIYLILLTCISLYYTIADLFVNIVFMFPFFLLSGDIRGCGWLAQGKFWEIWTGCKIRSLFSVLENNKANAQSESDNVSSKPTLQTSSPFLSTSPQSSAVSFSVFQRPTSMSKFLIIAWFRLRK
jgi:hypothetical protein